MGSRGPARSRPWPGLLALALGSFLATAQAGTVTLNFEDLSLPATGLGSLGVPYDSQGYTLVSTSGFSVRGPGTDSANYTPDTSQGSGVVTTSLAAFAPGSMTLIRDDGAAFDLVSIDLAREFRFNTPDVGQGYPQVTFTGTTAGGGTVTQTFTADQVDFYFRTFTFSSAFTNLLAVSWDQPPFTSGTPTNPAPGLHQFDNVVLSTSVPEPSSVVLLGSAVAIAGLSARRRRPGLETESLSRTSLGSPRLLPRAGWPPLADQGFPRRRPTRPRGGSTKGFVQLRSSLTLSWNPGRTGAPSSTSLVDEPLDRAAAAIHLDRPAFRVDQPAEGTSAAGWSDGASPWLSAATGPAR